MTHLASIYRYPVKGLSPEPLEHVVLDEGEPVPGDRAYAIENGPGGFDPTAPQYLPKTKFLMLMRDERLAALETRLDEPSQILTVSRGGRQVARGHLGSRVGRQMIEQFLSAYMADALRGAPRIVHAPGHSFSDVPARVVSLINLESLRDIERVAGRPVDPLRFRANLYVDGLPAWGEFDWTNQEISVGKVKLYVLDRIERCAAINVEPGTGARDMNLPRTLMDGFGHVDCGIYLKVTSGGEIAAGDPVTGPGG